MSDLEDRREITTLKGLIVVEAKIGKDSLGYDVLVLKFSDKSRLVVTEEGQTGHFSVFHV